MGHSLFYQVCVNFPLVSSTVLIENGEEFQMIGWHKRRIVACTLSRDRILSVDTKSSPISFEEYNAQADVMSVFQWMSRLYIIDAKGVVYILEVEVSEDSDGDLFEDSSPKESSRLRPIFEMGPVEVLSACSTPDGIAALVQSHSSIDLYLASITESKVLHKIPLRDYEISKPDCKGGIVLFVQSDQITEDFVRNWFPRLSFDELANGFLVVSLPKFIFCCVPIKHSRPLYFFSWPLRPISMHWTNGSETPKNLLNFVFDSGNLVRLSDFDGETFYFPLNDVKSTWMSSDLLLSSDTFDCYATYLTEGGTTQSFFIPLKGALAFCGSPSLNGVVLVNTRHRALYAFHTSQIKHQTELFTVPPSSTLDELVSSARRLEELNAQIHSADEQINALAVAQNSSKFQFDLKAQIVSRPKLLVRVIVQLCTPCIKISSTQWTLNFSFVSNSVSQTVTKHLDRDLTSICPLLGVFELELHRVLYLGLTVDFVSRSQIGKTRPSFHVGDIHLDVTHFIQPLSSLEIHKLYPQPHFDFTDVTKQYNLSSEIPPKNKICNVSISLDQPLDIILNLIQNSRPLWRAKEWSEIDKNEMKVVVGGSVVTLNLTQSNFVISGENTEICLALKSAVLLGFQKNLIFDESALMEVENMLKQIEILEFSDSLNEKELLCRMVERKTLSVSNVITEIDVNVFFT